MSSLSGLSLQDCFMLVDPRVRFNLVHDIIHTAGDIARMRKIPGDMGGTIYALYEDDQGFVYVGIAQSAGDDTPFEEWIADQRAHPFAKSLDRVDLLGNYLKDGGA